jgi:hypothetical protein
MELTKGATTMRLRLVFLVSVLSAGVLAACSGGGSSGTPSGSTPTSAPSGDAIQLFLVPASEGNGPIEQPSPGLIGVNLLSVPFTAVGQQQGVLVVETGFSGTFTGSTVDCPTNAVTVSPPSYTGLKEGVFVITAAAAGFCDVKFKDGSTTNYAEVLVDVTTTTGSISDKHR